MCSLSDATLIMPPLPQLNPDNATTTKAPVTTEDVRQYISMARGRLKDAMEFSICIYGMDSLDLDDPCYDICVCDTSLDCDTHVEAEFDVSKIQPIHLELYCYCAEVFNSPIDLNIPLKAPEGPYSVMLPS